MGRAVGRSTISARGRARPKGHRRTSHAASPGRWTWASRARGEPSASEGARPRCSTPRSSVAELNIGKNSSALSDFTPRARGAARGVVQRPWRAVVALHVIVNGFAAFCAMHLSTQARPSDPSSKKDLKRVGASIMAEGDRIRARRQVGPLVLDHGLHARLGARDVGPGHGLGVLHRRAAHGRVVEELLREAQIGIPQTVVQRIIIPVQHVLDPF